MLEGEALIPLPRPARDVPWPTDEWSRAELDSQVDAPRIAVLADRAFADRKTGDQGRTLALLVVHGGRLVFERYESGKDAATTFRSWSMAKSITHALVGLLIGEGHLELHGRAPVPAWRSADDPRSAITLDHLLRMVDGLDFVEHDEAAGRSDVLEMLGGAGKQDAAAWAEALPPAVPPETQWRYSSAATIVVCGIARRAIEGGADALGAFLRERLFEPIGMRSAAPRFDPAGTFLGSSYVFATARDFARFGLLYLRDGVGPGERILPAGWVDYGRTPTPLSSGAYGAHWWLPGDGGVFAAVGWRGQYTLIAPERDLVVVRLGSSSPAQRFAVERTLAELVECFPVVDLGLTPPA